MTRARSGSKQGTRDRALYCFGFHPWKYHYVARFLASHGEARFVTSPLMARLRGIDGSSAIVVWGSKQTEGLSRLAARYRAPIWRMEDGFLRSVGLGAERFTPASLVLDQSGIYYDPRTPSDLESILLSGVFGSDEIARARSLREQIVSMAVSKYNVGDRTAALPRAPSGKRVVLVPGQVEDDASIRFGCLDVRTNLDLLRAVREQRPDAFIVFKPHPDVVSGNRRGMVAPEDAQRYADAVVYDAPLPACLALAHEVHTMTSLVGFEALLRGIEVHAYGLPFYAGWGLTRDRHSHPRRTRTLDLDELVAGVLLRYPMYLDVETLLPTTPEDVVRSLGQAIRERRGSPIRSSWRERQTRKVTNAVRAVLAGIGK